jgi:hypothetical protein
MRKLLLCIALAVCSTVMAQQSDGEEQRTVLLEEFTTEQCVNCPRMAGWLEGLLSEESYSQRVILVEHHAGFGTDWLTTDYDSELLWFYNDNGTTYCPALMADRTPLEGDNTPVINPSSQDALKSIVDERLAEEPGVSLQVSGTFDPSTYEANIHVEGESLGSYPSRITVMMVEDDVLAKSQEGASGSFTHHNVTRKVNSTWGDELEWNGDNFSYECSMKIERSYMKKNVSFVVMVSDYDSADPTACRVANAAVIDEPSLVSTGISNLTNSTNNPTEYYSLSGIRLTTAPKGICIVKKADGSTFIMHNAQCIMHN